MTAVNVGLTLREPEMCLCHGWLSGDTVQIVIVRCVDADLSTILVMRRAVIVILFLQGGLIIYPLGRIDHWC